MHSNTPLELTISQKHAETAVAYWLSEVVLRQSVEITHVKWLTDRRQFLVSLKQHEQIHEAMTP